MKKIIRILSTATSAASLVMIAHSACAETVGTVLFAQEGAQIVSASGAVRPARRGDALQPGEQLTTSTNGISQVKLSDGSLIGIRPGSQLRMDATTPGSPSGQSMSLLQGAVRVIGAELMDKQKSSALTLQTGQATLRLNGADLESMVVRSGGRNDAGGDGRSAPRAGEPQPPLGGGPGSYNRLIAGTGNLRSGTAVEPLVARQVSFIPAGNPVPIQLASMPPAPYQSGAPAGSGSRPPSGAPGVPGAPTPPAPGVLPPGPPPAGSGGMPPGSPPAGLGGMPPGALPPAGLGGIPVLSPMTSTLTAPQFGPAGPAINQVGPAPAISIPNPGNTPPNFSPIATAAFPGGPKGPGPAMPVMAPAGGGAPGNIGRVGPPVNIRPPVICTPSPILGKPPICK